jgi:DnaJ-class molecular chaperone
MKNFYKVLIVLLLISFQLQAKRPAHEVLGVVRNASEKEITKAKRRLMMLYHTDRHPQDISKAESDRLNDLAKEVVEAAKEMEDSSMYKRLRNFNSTDSTAEAFRWEPEEFNSETENKAQEKAKAEAKAKEQARAQEQTKPKPSETTQRKPQEKTKAPNTIPVESRPLNPNMKHYGGGCLKSTLGSLIDLKV